jgi:hypothetical protein
MNKYGLVAWEDVELSNGKGGKGGVKKDLFLRLDKSEPNTIRILTKPHQYTVHNAWKVSEDEKGFGHRVPCAKLSGEVCPLCEDGVKVQTRWYVGVIDRKTQSFKILDISSMIFQGIKALNKHKSWGNPEGYDLDITINKDGGATGYYVVTPNPKAPLSNSDLVIKQKVDEEYALELVSRCKPPTREAVVKRCEAIRKMVEGKPTGKPSTTVIAAPKQDTVAQDSEDSDYEFTAPDAN